MPPVVCRFWQQGNCRFGDKCKFEHPGADRAQSNRYAPLQNSDNRNGNSFQSGASSSATLPYSLDKSAIVTDLTTERPQWIFSAYGPGRGAPAQLFGGPLREQSFEEMRLLHYIGLASGNPQQAIQEADKLYQAAEQQMQATLSNVDAAIDYIIRSEKEHPNRIDIVRESLGSTPGPQPKTFNQASSFPAAPAANTFGAPSKPAQSGAFAAPTQPTGAFGAPSQTTGGAFGQPSALGQKPNPFGAPHQAAGGAFGQPSALGQRPNPFVAPSQSVGGAFGQPSALGQKPNPFRAPSQPAGGTFGQPSDLGQKPNPFGTPSQSTGAFGQPSALGQTPSPFGAPAFGTPSQPNGFGQPSTLGQKPNPFSQNPQTSNTFGTPSQSASSNPFGASTQHTTNPFGSQNQTSQPPSFSNTNHTPFGDSSPSQNPFGAPAQATNPRPSEANSTQHSNPFGAQPPSANPFSNSRPGPGANAFINHLGKASATTSGSENRPFPRSAPTLESPHPPLNSYTSRDGGGRLTMFKGKRVIYHSEEPGMQSNDGTWEKIWFPDGEPDPNQDTSKDDALYDEKTKAAYLHARQTGVFPNGTIPLLPPKREWCRWDF